MYRVTPYRLDYYNYHRWSSPPGTMVSNYLQDAFSRSGRFRAVTLEASDSVAVVLGGRVIAIEEVDQSKTSWLGRVAVELTLTDTVTNKILWSQRFDETEPVHEQTPEGLARALSRGDGEDQRARAARRRRDRDAGHSTACSSARTASSGAAMIASIGIASAMTESASRTRTRDGAASSPSSARISATVRGSRCSTPSLR